MKNKSDIIVALLVIACSVALLGALVVAIGGNPWQKPAMRFTIDFPDVTGVHVNAGVMLSGHRIGSVDRIENLAPADRVAADRPVRVHVSIPKPLAIPADVKSAIGAESMLGEKHIALTGGDEAKGVLADGAHLTSPSVGSMIETLVPGGDKIIDDLKGALADIKKLTGDFVDAGLATKLKTSLSNVEAFSTDLKSVLAGDDKTEGLTKKLHAMADKLDDASGRVRDLIKGPDGAEEKGLAGRSSAVFEKLEAFSKELNNTLAGGPDGKPGLRARINEITDDIHGIFAGNKGTDKNLQNRLHTVMGKVDTLMEEMNALIVWGEYVTGTLAGKPSRLIFGSKENEVPTKEQIIEHLREKKQSFPVRIREEEAPGAKKNGSKPAAQPKAAPSSKTEPPKTDATDAAKKKGIFDFLKKSE
ncbi:MAG: MlaD family protein [Verrucomicrobiaceae bacterium]|nr:MlaD family protein [Verrucomicrobiaceae bacterium]